MADTAAAVEAPVDSLILVDLALTADGIEMELDVLIDEYAEKVAMSTGLTSLEPIVLDVVIMPVAGPDEKVYAINGNVEIELVDDLTELAVLVAVVDENAVAFAVLMVTFVAVARDDTFEAPTDAGCTVKEAEFRVGDTK